MFSRKPRRLCSARQMSKQAGEFTWDCCRVESGAVLARAPVAQRPPASAAAWKVGAKIPDHAMAQPVGQTTLRLQVTLIIRAAARFYSNLRASTEIITRQPAHTLPRLGKCQALCKLAIAQGGNRTRMPFGATPSRWAVGRAFHCSGRRWYQERHQVNSAQGASR